MEQRAVGLIDPDRAGRAQLDDLVEAQDQIGADENADSIVRRRRRLKDWGGHGSDFALLAYASHRMSLPTSRSPTVTPVSLTSPCSAPTALALTEMSTPPETA